MVTNSSQLDNWMIFQPTDDIFHPDVKKSMEYLESLLAGSNHTFVGIKNVVCMLNRNKNKATF